MRWFLIHKPRSLSFTTAFSPDGKFGKYCAKSGDDNARKIAQEELDDLSKLVWNTPTKILNQLQGILPIKIWSSDGTYSIRKTINNLKPKTMRNKKRIEELEKKVREQESDINYLLVSLKNHKLDNKREEAEVANCLVAITGRLERLVDYLGIEEKRIPSEPEKTILVKKSKKK